MEKVISCTKVRDWEKDGKKVPIYSVAFSDGQGGESFGKEIPVGTPMSDLTIEASQYGNKIKLKNQGNSGGGYGGRSRSGNESFALSYAKDYACAKVGNGKEFKGEDILKLADLFYNWLEKKKSPEQQPKQNPVVIPNNEFSNKGSGEVSLGSRNIDSDLPF